MIPHSPGLNMDMAMDTVMGMDMGMGMDIVMVMDITMMIVLLKRRNLSFKKFRGSLEIKLLRLRLLSAAKKSTTSTST